MRKVSFQEFMLKVNSIRHGGMIDIARAQSSTIKRMMEAARYGYAPCSLSEAMERLNIRLQEQIEEINEQTEKAVDIYAESVVVNKE